MLSEIQTSSGEPTPGSSVVPGRAWRIIHDSLTAVDDVLYPHDPAVLRAIHEFDPNVIPCFARVVYQAATGAVRVFGWHVIASHVWNRRYRVPKWVGRLMMPTTGSVLRPTQIDLHLKDRELPKGQGLPGYGAFLPFDWRVHKLLRTMYREYTVQQFMQQQKDIADAKSAARIKADEEMEYRIKHTARSMGPHFENMDENDMRKLLARAGESPSTQPSPVLPFRRK
jgi:hypothetical protein